MVGTGGTSPFGAFGDHPAELVGRGVNVRRLKSGNSPKPRWRPSSWNSSDANCLLRKFARQGAAEELDVDGRKQLSKVSWMFRWCQSAVQSIDVVWCGRFNGCSYCPKLFSAAKTEFKTLEYFYFVFMTMFGKITTEEQLRVMGFVSYLRTRLSCNCGRCMAPYELKSVGGSVEYMNEVKFGYAAYVSILIKQHGWNRRVLALHTNNWLD